MIDGKEAWSKTLPFTLYDAVVTNDGTSIGYAYEHSYEGFALTGGYKAGAGNLHVVILEPNGGVRLDEITKREHSLMLHSPAEPVVRGILLHEADDRFTIRTTGMQGESWWVYQCSSGKALNRFDLRKTTAVPEVGRGVDAATPVIGTPLSLIHWSRYDREKKQMGALFMLVDQDGVPVWSRELPADYTIPGNEAAEDKLRAMIWRRGAILDAAKPNQFELWFVAESQRVLFSVTRDQAMKEGWRIEEVARHPYQPPSEEKVPPPIENRPLAHLGSFKLQSEAPTGAIRDVRSFEFDADGRIGMIRWNSTSGYTFVLLDQTGKPITEVPVAMREKGSEIGTLKAAMVGEGRWVIVATERGGDERSWARWFDEEKKAFGEVINLDCATIEAVAGTGDGGFVILSTRHARYSLTSELYAFGRDGKRLWRHAESSGDEPGNLFSPEDVTVTRNGEIAVVDNIQNQVQFFNLRGAYLRTVDLTKSWGREPNYPSGIMPDIEGGFIVYDFNGKTPFMRMRANGSVREPLQPRYRDGSVVDTLVGIRVAADGRLWTSDQQALLRLDKKGVVDLTLGEAPSSETLGKIAHATGDGNGNLYVVDERTGAVHVFNSEGKRLRVSKPAPGDFTGNLRQPQITVTDNGSVYLSGDRFTSDRPGYVDFGPDGNRRGIRAFNLGGVGGQEWHAQHGTENVLVLEYHTAFLMGAKGDVLKKIERRADRLWLDQVSDASFASDGSFVILSDHRGKYGSNQAITLYTKDGTPVRTFQLPPKWSMLTGYNGSHLVLRSGKAIEIYDNLGAPVQSFPVPDGNDWSIFLTRGGRELWTVEFPTRTVQRYAMP